MKGNSLDEHPVWLQIQLSAQCTKKNSGNTVQYNSKWQVLVIYLTNKSIRAKKTLQFAPGRNSCVFDGRNAHNTIDPQTTLADYYKACSNVLFIILEKN